LKAHEIASSVGSWFNGIVMDKPSYASYERKQLYFPERQD